MKVFLNKSLLITRPISDSLAFKAHIKKLNSTIRMICSPLFEIEYFAVKYDLSATKGILITSPNAIRSLEKSKIRFNGPVFCVGSSTALLAQKFGYKPVTSNGNTDDLVDLIQRSVSVSLGKLTYFRGEKTIGELGALLREAFYDVDEVICYRKLPNGFSEKIISDIDKGLIIGATFFSKETVRLFHDQVKYIPDQFVAFCISKEVSSDVLEFYPKSRLSVRVAKEPTVWEMSKLVVAAPEFAP